MESSETITTARVTHVCRVFQLLPDRGTVGVTAIDKRSVEGKVKVGKLGLYADVQADRAHHGGDEQAVYAFAAEDAAVWAAELGREIAPGEFGENLRTEGLDVSNAVIGTRCAIGSAEFEVTIPRTPCSTFARRMGEDNWVQRFTDNGNTGAYLRVTRKGSIQAGDEITVTFLPSHGVSVKDLFRGPTPAQARALQDAEKAGELQLTPKVVREVLRVL
ncbi:MOSC domain-containing protein [Neomicrococcus aestuarii]|uniref:MOSC domain-containing protein YiiM n=1 Tax=Neomicrococcus aestuarii TaxID=556325 RepID=A0A7W8TV08_9MICC|nr:MOSC domain-containing protein [Neomicrococcus aestuarii]MBB5513422.1 MOSC domain-containing protein YiiM [Neomicrococcus aestuarii]